MTDERDALLELAVFGREVDNFLSSSVGIYLNQKITEEINRAMNALRNVNPANPGEVAASQARATVMIDLSNWLTQAIAAGQQAELALQEPEYGDQTAEPSI